MKDYVTLLANKIVELSANQIDMNDLYTEEQFNTSAISSDMTFDEFYKLVSETDSELAARIDKWFMNHSKNMVFDAIKKLTTSKVKEIINGKTLTAKEFYEEHKPSIKTKPKTEYMEDPCRRGGWSRGTSC